jgi:hypothetical protein
MLGCVARGAFGAATTKINGIVADKTSGGAISSARVRLSQGADGGIIAETSSGGDGRFGFRDVPKGVYTVSAEKNGYAAVLPGDASRVVSVTDTAMPPTILRLGRGSAITGSVLDASGQLLRGVGVAAVARRSVNGVARLVVAAGPFETDDRGTYRIYGLLPGRYSLALLPDGEHSFAPVYFPGTVDPESARFLEMAAGESRNGVDLVMPPAATGKIHGRVTGIPSDWRPRQTAVALLSTTGLRSQIQTVQAGEDGGFDFIDVPPGIYRTVAWGPVVGMGAPLPRPGQRPENGALRVRIDGEDLDDLEIPLHVTAVVEGFVQFEPGAEPVDCLGTGQLALHPVDPLPAIRFLRADLSPGGRFVFGAVPVGSYTVKVKGLKGDCYLSGARLGQGRSGSGPIAVEGDATLTLFIGRQTGEIAGAVADPDGSPTPAATVQIVPVDGGGEAGMDDVLIASSDAAGQFSIKCVPPGRYQILALTEVVSVDYLDPSFRKDRGAVEIEVKPRARAQVVLRVSP